MCEVTPPSGSSGKSLSDWYELQGLVEENGSDLVHNNITKLVKCLHKCALTTYHSPKKLLFGAPSAKKEQERVKQSTWKFHLKLLTLILQ